MKLNEKQIYSVKCYVVLFIAGVVSLLFAEKSNVFIFWFVISVFLICSIAILSNSENVRKSEYKIDSLKLISSENEIQPNKEVKFKFWILWLKSTVWVYVIGCFIVYVTNNGRGDALAAAIGSYLVKAPILGYIIARGIKYRSKQKYE
jgi:uncharacterized membrane protein